MKRYFTCLLVLVLLCGAACAEAAPAGLTKPLTLLFVSDMQGGDLTAATALRDELMAANHVLLIDLGDALPEDKNAAPVHLAAMNAAGVDLAVPGERDLAQGVEGYRALIRQTNVTCLCANIVEEGEPVFMPYVLRDFEGVQVAFIGLTTPYAASGTAEPSYSFCEDGTGNSLCFVVQNAVDNALAEGADYVVVLGHVGIGHAAEPYASPSVIAGTMDVDAVLDGHWSVSDPGSFHPDLIGETVLRVACSGPEWIGALTIHPDGRLTSAVYPVVPAK